MDRLGRLLAASGLEIPCRFLLQSMAKAGGISKPLIRGAAVDDESDMKKSDAENVIDANGASKSHRWFGNPSKITPNFKSSKKRSWSFRKKPAVSRQKKKSFKNSEIIINVQESDADCEKVVNCETEFGLNGINGNYDGQNSDDTKENQDDKPDTLSSRENNDFSEEMTPMGRVLVPVRQDGGSSCGYNALFISPCKPLHAAMEPPKVESSLGSRLRGWLRPATSSVNMKIFGGIRGVAKEQQRMKQTVLLIHPYSTFRYVFASIKH